MSSGVAACSTTCPSGEYSLHPRTRCGCTACSQPACASDEYPTGCSGTDDTECGKCASFTCGSDEYRSGTCGPAGANYACTKCSNTDCPGDRFRGGACGAAADNPALNGFTCTECSNVDCLAGQYRTGVCGGTTDGFECAACDNIDCGTDLYRTGTCSGDNNGYKCVACDYTSCSDNQYRTGSCQGTTNEFKCNICDNIDCGTDLYRTGICSGVDNGYGCLPCADAVCSDNQYRTGSCGDTTNAFKCNACDNIVCGDNLYRTGYCGDTTNGFTCNQCDNVECPYPGHVRTGICADTQNEYTCDCKPTQIGAQCQYSTSTHFCNNLGVVQKDGRCKCESGVSGAMCECVSPDPNTNKCLQCATVADTYSAGTCESTTKLACNGRDLATWLGGSAPVVNKGYEGCKNVGQEDYQPCGNCEGDCDSDQVSDGGQINPLRAFAARGLHVSVRLVEPTKTIARSFRSELIWGNVPRHQECKPGYKCSQRRSDSDVVPGCATSGYSKVGVCGTIRTF